MATAGASASTSRTALSAPDDRGKDRDQPGDGVDVRVMAEDQEREVEEVAVEAGEALSHPRAGDIANARCRPRVMASTTLM